jgi:hypothetical protein
MESAPTQGWTKTERKKKVSSVTVKRHYWSGFNTQGKERWYIELSNGRVVSHLDENYQYWLKKYKMKVKSSGM